MMRAISSIFIFLKLFIATGLEKGPLEICNLNEKNFYLYEFNFNDGDERY